MLISHLFLLSTLRLTFAQTCYYPNGDVAPGDVPCNPNSPYSACCADSYACLSNNICRSPVRYARGSCTDASWESTSCPLFCINPDYDNLGGGTDLEKCEDDSADSYTCINGQNSSCERNQNVLRFDGVPTVITIIGEPSSTTSASRSDDKEATSSSLPSTTSSNPSTTTTSSSNPTTAASGSGTNTTAIAAGVAAPLGAVAISVMVYLLFRYRSKSRGGDRHGSTERKREDPAYTHGPSMDPPQYAPHDGRMIKEPVSGGWPPQEMSEERRQHELASTPRAAELPASH